jgi:hypothetical protein
MFAAWCRSEFHHIVVNTDYSLCPPLNQLNVTTCLQPAPHPPSCKHPSASLLGKKKTCISGISQLKPPN